MHIYTQRAAGAREKEKGSNQEKERKKAIEPTIIKSRMFTISIRDRCVCVCKFVGSYVRGDVCDVSTSMAIRIDTAKCLLTNKLCHASLVI